MKQSDWISVEDRLPEVGEKVLVCTVNDKFGISSMYIPKDVTAKVLGYKRWRSSAVMSNAITHWQPIVLPKKK